MLQIQSNSRQIPDTKRYTADKKYNDLLYGILQQESVLIDGNRYVDRKLINFVALGARMKVSRQTASTKFKDLVNLGLVDIDYSRPKYYRLNYLDRTDAALVPLDTLEMLTDTLGQYTISIYVYLLNRYIANEEQSFTVTMTQMKSFIGIAATTTSNNHVINNILYVLQELHFIEYKLVQTDVDHREIVIMSVTNRPQRAAC